MFQFKINHHILYTRDTFQGQNYWQWLLSCVWIEADPRASFCRMPACPLLLEPFTSWWNDNNSALVSLTNNDKIYRCLPEKRSYHTVDLCLIVARFYIYTTAKESEPYSFWSFKAFLKYKLSIEPSSVRESLSFLLHTSLTCSVDFCYWVFCWFTLVIAISCVRIDCCLVPFILLL